jgi:ABC-2 type transport system ATP-binding protein
VLVVSNLEKRYGPVTALRGVSFTAGSGEVLGFLGPNGAGKTTTLRIITGFLAPTAGQVTVGGYDVATDPCTVRALIGYLPESVPLYPEMRVREYLDYRAALKGVPARERRARIDEAAALVGLEDALGRIAGQLSRGFRQRVGLCDALTHRPPVLVLDEPTEGLDPNQRRELLALVRELGRERTVVLSTHVLPEAETLCDRVVILDRGQVAAAGTPAELGAGGDAAQILIEARGDTPAIVAAIEALADVTAVVSHAREGGVTSYQITARSDVREAAARAVLEAGGALRELKLAVGALDVAFARWTRRPG